MGEYVHICIYIYFSHVFWHLYLCSTFSQSRSPSKRVNAKSLLCVIVRVFSYGTILYRYTYSYIHVHALYIHIYVHTYVRIYISNNIVCLFSEQCYYMYKVCSFSYSVPLVSFVVVLMHSSPCIYMHMYCTYMYVSKLNMFVQAHRYVVILYFCFEKCFFFSFN